jgi:hypothetical protein
MGNQKNVERKDKNVFLKRKRIGNFSKGQRVTYKPSDNKDFNYGSGVIREFCDDSEFIQCNFDSTASMNPVVVRVSSLVKGYNQKLKDKEK